uniref:NAD(P)H-dependent glycerol-3-phosphate dehydrogenase n=1 Tax=Alicyclobacillus tolerans TaxID=90970 RepID=UPI0023513F1B|nr:NAD(P)H-dependent glycerol-3-phosphate dehydrogenase [Alicyclobacillus tolerans]
MKAAVLGSGSWGTALASVLADNDHQTILWARRAEVAYEIVNQHTNKQYLPAASLHPKLTATTQLDEALDGAQLVVFAVPSGSMAQVTQESVPYMPDNAWLAHAVKGFDPLTKRRMSQVLADVFPDAAERVCVISGPSHAEEVVSKLPTTIVVSSLVQASAETVQDALMNRYLRVYTNPDVIGTELGGSLKNIIAISVGIADGLGFGDNAKAALMTRGLAEIARLGVKMGASPLTFAGLSGVGDLIVTCTSQHSRNFRTGRLLGQGKSVQEALAKVGMVVEGIPTTQAAVELAARYEVEMPITEVLAQVLFEGKDPAKSVVELMGRERSHEIEEVAREKISPKWLK